MGFFKRCFCIPRTADKDLGYRSESEDSVQRMQVPSTPQNGAPAAPLATAAAAGDHMRVKVLLREGADPNQREQGNDRTALHLAVAKNKRSAALALLEAKADPNARDQDGQTPLHLAAMYNAHDIVPMLLLAGADLSITDKNGRGPLDLAPDAASSVSLRRAILLAAEQGGGIKGVEAILNHPATPPAKDATPAAFAPDRTSDDTAPTYDQAISAPRRTPAALPPAAALLPPRAPSYSNSTAPDATALKVDLPSPAPAPINTTKRVPSPALTNGTASPAASTRSRSIRPPSPTASSPTASSRSRSHKAPSPSPPASAAASPAAPHSFRAPSPPAVPAGLTPPSVRAPSPAAFSDHTPDPTADLPPAAAVPKPPSPTPPAPATAAALTAPPLAPARATAPPTAAAPAPAPLLTVSAAEAFASTPPRASSPGSAPVPSPGLPLEGDEASAYAASATTDTGASSGGLVSKLFGIKAKPKKSKLATDESAPSPPLSPMAQKARLRVEQELGAAAVQQQLDLAHLSLDERMQVSEELAEVLRRREMRMSLKAEDVEDAIHRVRLASRPEPSASQQSSDFTPVMPQHQQARSFLANLIPELAIPPPGLDSTSTTTTNVTNATTTGAAPSVSSATAHTAQSDFSTRSAATATLHSTAASPAPPAPPATPPNGATAAPSDYDFLPTPPPSNPSILQSATSNYSYTSALDDPLRSATPSNPTHTPAALAAPPAVDPATPLESLLSDNLAPISENPQDDETWLTSSDPADPRTAAYPPSTSTTSSTTPIASSDLNLPSIRASPKVLTPKTPSVTPPPNAAKKPAANGSALRTTPGTVGSAPPADRTPPTGGLLAAKKKSPASAPPSSRIPRLDVSPGTELSTPGGRPKRSPASTPRSAPRITSRLEELATPRGTKRTPLSNPTPRSASFSGATPRSSSGGLYTPRRSFTSTTRSLRGSVTSIASSTNIDDRPPWRY